MDWQHPRAGDQPRRVRLGLPQRPRSCWASSVGERGVALFVDAIQGLGPLVHRRPRTPIDFLAADGHKWLLGPEGAGLALRAPRLDRSAAAPGRGLAQRRRVVQLARDRLSAQAQRAAVGGGLVQHARPAGARRQREPAPGARSGRGFQPHPRPGPGRPRGWRRGPAGG